MFLLLPQEEPPSWDLSIKILKPKYHRQSGIYVCGVGVRGSTVKSQSSQFSINFESEIFGQFKVQGRLKKELEKTLVKIQGPSLLLPYLRATITSYFANAGLGHIIFPLINIHKVAEDSLKDMEITVVG